MRLQGVNAALYTDSNMFEYMHIAMYFNMFFHFPISLA
jgi:hypothetical protein